jgi:hypothetical protein
MCLAGTLWRYEHLWRLFTIRIGIGIGIRHDNFNASLNFTSNLDNSLHLAMGALVLILAADRRSRHILCNRYRPSYAVPLWLGPPSRRRPRIGGSLCRRLWLLLLPL